MTGSQFTHVTGFYLQQLKTCALDIIGAGVWGVSKGGFRNAENKQLCSTFWII